MGITHKKNTPYSLILPMVDAEAPDLYRSGETITITARYKNNGDVWTIFTPDNTASEVAATGTYRLELTASDLNHDYVFITFSSPFGATTSIGFDLFTVVAQDFAGPGATTVPITINTTLGIPMSGVSVWLTSDPTGVNTIAGAAPTDAFGDVQFLLNPGTYYVQLFKAGCYFASSPYTLTFVAETDFPFVYNVGTAAQPPTGNAGQAGLDIIEPGIPTRDGCPVLQRVKAYIIDEGVSAILQHTFVDRAGAPVDLENAFSEDPSAEPPIVTVRIREETGYCAPSDPVYEVPGVIIDPVEGIIQAALPDGVIDNSGIYRVSFAYIKDDRPVLINGALLSVEHTLWGATTHDSYHRQGPPTIGDLRMQIMDFAPDNLLLDEVEFSDDQIIQAIIKPIHEFNDSPPPLRPLRTTKSFEYRNEWLDATIGYLYQFAAAHYRRNRLPITGGGIGVDDKGKEAEYLQASQLMLSRWRDWYMRKKIQLNGESFYSSIYSSY